MKSSKLLFALIGSMALSIAGLSPATAATDLGDERAVVEGIGTTQRIAGETGPTLDLGEPNGSTSLGGSEVGVGGTDGGISPLAASVTYSPAGCKGTTDYPHKSTSAMREASVHGRTKCVRQVAIVQVQTNLYRDRWNGLELLDGRFKSSINQVRTEDATPHWNCSASGTHSYRAYSTHKSYEGKWYTAATNNWQLPGMSRFSC